MTTRFFKDGNEILTDFLVGEPEDEHAIWVPFGNLPVYTDAELATLGVTKTVTEDPIEITPLQGLLWLAAHGKSEADVLTLIDSIPDTTTRLQAKAYWQRAERFHSNNGFIQMLWLGLGLSTTPQAAFEEARLL